MEPHNQRGQIDDHDHTKMTTALNPQKGRITTADAQFPAIQGEIISHSSQPHSQPTAGFHGSIKQFRTNLAKKGHSARSPNLPTAVQAHLPAATTLNQINTQFPPNNIMEHSNFPLIVDEERASSHLDTGEHAPSRHGRSSDENTVQAQYHSLLDQVQHWLQTEKSKAASLMRLGGHERSLETSNNYPNGEDSSTPTQSSSQPGSSLALENLEAILSRFSINPNDPSGGFGSSGTVSATGRSSSRRRRRGSVSQQGKRGFGLKGLRRGSVSDSDHADNDPPVPSADVVLDNSKTLLYSGGEAEPDIDSPGMITGKSSTSLTTISKDKEYWLYFKSEILKLTHTLGFKGWRRIPLDSSRGVEVVRLSGALTNAVYVVSPPKNFSSFGPGSSTSVTRKSPPKLLLRIYGPQVEHLIDREHELRILRRLGRRNIGPRVLGTFKNGRFEQYLYARTLTPKDLRVPETSVKIAKRMRELHDGIDILPEEREAGPGLWKNWDKWVNRCERVITWLDREILSDHGVADARDQPWRNRGLVCGVPWAIFRATVEKYRKWLDASFGGSEGTKHQLIFAHNDTQYGNLLRLEPSGESPLLLPANEHKQLVVIDFEYASANMRGVEFANHFTEWCYNYHDEERPWGCNPAWYPTIEQQRRFIRAYLCHRPYLLYTDGGSEYYSTTSSAMTTPGLRPTLSSSQRVPTFNLDTYIPGAPTEDDDHDEELEAQIQQLLRETRLWRIANSAQWVAWGVVQAKVPGIGAALGDSLSESSHGADGGDGVEPAPALTGSDSGSSDEDTGSALTPTQDSIGVDNMLATTNQAIQEAEEDEAADEFDYLGYAQDRALFFWADILSLGLIKEDELPKQMVEDIRSRMIDR
ncbi:hypothetical protein FQN57_000106 [Myotisia sp. PD_48]|nr:hypothetical protein FQN57_000106 [Myotisia sp. PD_48]